ncbi:hypothetical protein F5Y19DRAFT_492074 [Xylariaceae sp. FL1651]|nr:hypothetical protein F5Y19DRAFT_492074 [Xylariaceae sp. FL1651]
MVHLLPPRPTYYDQALVNTTIFGLHALSTRCFSVAFEAPRLFHVTSLPGSKGAKRLQIRSQIDELDAREKNSTTSAAFGGAGLIRHVPPPSTDHSYMSPSAAYTLPLSDYRYDVGFTWPTRPLMVPEMGTIPLYGSVGVPGNYQSDQFSQSFAFDSAQPSSCGISIGTDSGYASWSGYPGLTPVGQRALTSALSNRDNHTTYSDLSSLSNGKVDNFISEFAVELVSGLPQSISIDQLPCLSATLPNLIEAFAGRFGHNKLSRVHCYLASLVSRYRVQISDSVIGAFTEEEEDDNEAMISPPSNRSDMLLEDKIALWQSKEKQIADDPADIMVQDLNTDFIDEFIPFPALQEYRDAVLSSPAYTWLMSAITKKLELETVSPFGVGLSSRQSILMALGDPAVADTYHVIFRSQGIASWLTSPNYDMESVQALPRVIVLVGKENQAYATTCGEYARLVWPQSGAQIVNLVASIKPAIHGSIASCTLLDGTELVAQTMELNSVQTMEISVTGCSDAIAEVGEQLAWLNTALSSPHYMFNQSSTISLRPYCKIIPSAVSLFADSLVKMSGIRADRLAVFELDSHPRSYYSVASIQCLPSGANHSGICWTDSFGELVLVEELPIPRRILSNSGLEISLLMMAALTNAQKVAVYSGKMLIKGFSTALIPTQHCNKFVFWHLVFNENGDHLDFNDSRINKILDWYPTGLNMGDLERSRHILGWCVDVKNKIGAIDANYSIGWSGLRPPRPGLAFEKVSIAGGMFITGGASLLIGKKDKAVHLRSRDDYIMRLKWISKKFVVLYDVREKRAWLTDGLSAVLHLVRASLKHDTEDSFKTLFLYDPSALKETSWMYLGKDTAIRVLTNPENLSLPLYAKPNSTKEEINIDDTGAQTRILSKTKSNFCLKDRIESICDVLEQIMAHQADVATQDGVGFRLRSTPRRHLEGFDFMDIATDEDPFWPRMAELKASGRGWVDFTRALHAITLFGSGFGELIQPFKRQALPCEACSVYDEVPKGRDLLAVCVRDIQDVMQKRGSKNTIPWRLIDNIYWHTPDKTFEPCNHAGKASAKHDRVQVLLPATFPGLWGRNFQSPPDLDMAPMGALLFGHSTRFPLRWSDRGDPEEGQPDQELEELESSFHDSGIGASLASSSLVTANDSSSQSRTSQLSPGSNARYADAAASEDEQPVKRRKFKQEPHDTGEIWNMGSGLPQAESSQSQTPQEGRLSAFLGPIHGWMRKEKSQGPGGW